MSTDLPPLRPTARRGKAYFDELRAIVAEIAPDLRRDVEAIKAERKIKTRDLCVLALRYRLNFKATVEALEDMNLLACGVYDRIKDSGFPIMASLREVWAEMPQEVER